MRKPSSTIRALKIAKKRKDIVRSFLQLKSLIGSGKAARALRVSEPTLYRWNEAYKANGLSGLIPKFSNSGRRSTAEGVRLTAKAVRELEKLIVAKGRQTGWQSFLQSRYCPPAVARMKLKSLPAPLARMVKLTPLPARCTIFATADGKRLFLKVSVRGGTKQA